MKEIVDDLKEKKNEGGENWKDGKQEGIKREGKEKKRKGERQRINKMRKDNIEDKREK